jgi:hypothetical protein
MGANGPAHSDGAFWRYLLPAFCAVATVVGIVSIVGLIGVGGRPWCGFWDAYSAPTSRPFMAEIVNESPRGAAAKAGIRDGDTIDLRAVDVRARVAVLFQPLASAPTRLTVDRDGRTFTTTLLGSTIFDGDVLFKIENNAAFYLGLVLALCCAWLIALRSWQSRTARLLCLMLLALTAAFLSPQDFVTPDGATGAMLYAFTTLTTCALAVIPVALALGFGVRTRARTAVTALAYVSAALVFAGSVACAAGIITVAIDPIPFVFGTFWSVAEAAMFAIALVAIGTGVRSAARAERVRAAWLLVPIPLAELLSTVAFDFPALSPSWLPGNLFVTVGNVGLLAGIVAVTYALLRRRVLDFQFVIARTLVVACVSAIIVVSFVLLEWLLGAVLSTAGHLTGVVANAGLALVLGLSMSFIHKRVDAFVDYVFFHKRREDERALRAFAKEATFVSDREDLFDLTIAMLRKHTDAGSATIFVDGTGGYRAVRSLGSTSDDISENDAAILALKARHAPIDPHRFETALHGDVALPMLGRGRLVGVLACGARTSGEAYTPDEIEALRELAHGVGIAFEGIERHEAARAGNDAVLSELRALRDVMERIASTSFPANGQR